MPCRCEAESAGCKCTFTAGLNITLEGSGTPSDPIQVHVDPAFLQAVNGTGTTVALTGDGGVSNPYIINIELAPALYEGKAYRWVGSDADLAYNPPPADAVAAVTFGGVKRLVGLVNLYGGTTRFVRVYAGDVMVADESGGGVLGPGL